MKSICVLLTQSRYYWVHLKSPAARVSFTWRAASTKENSSRTGLDEYHYRTRRGFLWSQPADITWRVAEDRHEPMMKNTHDQGVQLSRRDPHRCIRVKFLETDKVKMVKLSTTPITLRTMNDDFHMFRGINLDTRIMHLIDIKIR